MTKHSDKLYRVEQNGKGELFLHLFTINAEGKAIPAAELFGGSIRAVKKYLDGAVKLYEKEILNSNG